MVIPLNLASSGGDPITKFILILSNIDDMNPILAPYIRLGFSLFWLFPRLTTQSLIHFLYLGK